MPVTDMKLEIRADKIADTVYLSFSDKNVAYSRALDSRRVVDYSEDGEIRGIQFLSASSGLNTGDLPHRSAIERAFRDSSIDEPSYGQTASRLASDFAGDARNSGEILWGLPVKARTEALKGVGVAVLIFLAFAAADVLLARNLFVLSSLLGILASMLGLVLTLFPTVIGCFIALAWVLYARGQANRL